VIAEEQPMAMLVDYIDSPLSEQAFYLAQKKLCACQYLHRVTSKKEAYENIFSSIKYNNDRTKVIIISDYTPKLDLPDNIVITHIQGGNIATLCEEIAISNERVGAIIVNNCHGSSFFRKKVRELASAEGAILIFDEIDPIFTDEIYSITKLDTADIVLFEWQGIFWLGSNLALAGINNNQFNIFSQTSLR
jgi:hypothetical protein